MDPLESIDPVRETTSHSMYECDQGRHAVFSSSPTTAMFGATVDFIETKAAEVRAAGRCADAKGGVR